MEVGLMLNASPEDADQPKPPLTLEATIRSRTPWDAGGYSLPVNHDQDAAISKHIHHNDSFVESSQIYPTKHGLSDSRSSLSSFASASTSTHSRFSSASTVGGFHAFSNFTDSVKISDSTVDWTSLLANSATLSPVSPATFSFHHYPPSPHPDPINVLAQIAEQQNRDADIPSQGQYNDSNMDTMDTTRTSPASDPPSSLSRTASPTDALLIKRRPSLMLPEFEMPTERESSRPFFGGEENILSQMHQTQPRLDGLISFPLLDIMQNSEPFTGRVTTESRQHKRAFSEPHIQDKSRALFGQPAGMMMVKYQRSEPTPPSSQHPENDSPRAEMLDTIMRGDPQYKPSLQDQQSTCMFKEGCDTGSQPRKAVSHIFGRNKMCTRLIPEHVWVRYCRKHYQRSRYREPNNWPRCQCDLVQKQIQRLEEWSADNERRGEGGIVRGWGLTVRKREQKRLDDLALSNVRGARGDTIGDRNDEELDPTAPATAVPLWLRNLCGKTYSTPDIRDIFNRVHRELLNSQSPVFPDIEILPHITLDGDEPESPVRYGRRKVQTSHQRSRSMGVSLPQPSRGFPEGLQFRNAFTSNQTNVLDQLEIPLHHKRKRLDCFPEDLDAELISQNQRLRLNATTAVYEHESQRPIPSASLSSNNTVQGQSFAGSHGPQLLTPAMSNVSIQSPSSGSEFNRGQQRSNMLLMPESNHRRSRSDINSFSFPKVSNVPHLRSHSGAYQFPENIPEGLSGAHMYQPAFTPTEDERPTPQRRRSGSGHSRHQSTPAAQRLSLTPPSGLPHLPSLLGSQFGSAYNNENNFVLPRLSIQEPGEAQDECHGNR